VRADAHPTPPSPSRRARGSDAAAATAGGNAVNCQRVGWRCCDACSCGSLPPSVEAAASSVAARHRLGTDCSGPSRSQVSRLRAPTHGMLPRPITTFTLWDGCSAACMLAWMRACAGRLCLLVHACAALVCVLHSPAACALSLHAVYPCVPTPHLLGPSIHCRYSPPIGSIGRRPPAPLPRLLPRVTPPVCLHAAH